MTQPHPDFGFYYQILSSERGRALAKAWEGRGFRAPLPKWVSRPYRFTGTGAILAGGRWNVPKLFPAIYFSLDAETMAAEADAKARRYGWTPEFLLPQTRVTSSIRLHKVLNLVDTAVQGQIRAARMDMIACDWAGEQAKNQESLTQAIGRAAFEAGFEGLLVPSARREGGVNLIYFPSNRIAESSIETIGETDIPFVHGLP